MATAHGDGSSPSALARETIPELTLIVDFWNRYRVCDELGGSNREVLDELERRVTECVNRKPPDLDEARALTAQALWLIQGRGEP